MCLLCFSDKPLGPDEKKGARVEAMGQYDGSGETFDVPLCKVWCCHESCGCCLGTMLCYCCSQMYVRHKALNHVNPGSGWSDYQCCQGYFGGCCCLQPGKCGDKQCPVPCMCLESCCCPGLAVSATSMVIRQKYQLELDKDDIRLIRCTNCLQILACCCYIVACLTDCDAIDIAARVTGCLADAVFCSVAGCMTAQVNHEINLRDGGGGGPSAPQTEMIEDRQPQGGFAAAL
eukprot:CAMPEP_0168783926 /NCGR_PEP_ID=MMETSP0725-20121227/9950_1 /TAXON_ID=265536 /ORGANISM="Amphiprora sp., Strain CCMP467" /LENGTH=231 /DNA_ID=CAMNT_0008833943 /DNA_START=103 /DNA_END=798 /DNA_ORIENTATION=-